MSIIKDWWLAKLCKYRGHLRGKRVPEASSQHHITYRCPRCNERWTRPVRTKAA